jgi:hypothetical protein
VPGNSQHFFISYFESLLSAPSRDKRVAPLQSDWKLAIDLNLQKGPEKGRF